VIPVHAAAKYDCKAANAVASDFPAGVTVLVAGYMTYADMAQLAGASPAAMQKAGILQAYHTQFWSKNPTATGIFDGQVITGLFANAAGATGWYNFTARQLMVLNRGILFAPGLPLKNSAGLSFVTKINSPVVKTVTNVTIDRFTIVFTDGPFMLYVIFDMMPSRTSAETIKMAGLVYARVASQLK